MPSTPIQTLLLVEDNLVVRSAKPSAHTLVVQDLDLEGEVLMHLQGAVSNTTEQRHNNRDIFDSHHEERQLNSQCLFRARRTADVIRTQIGSCNLDHA